MTDKVPFGPALRRLVQDKEITIDVHPSVADLLAYYDGRFPQERLDEFRDHVAICSACATTLLEFAQAAEPADTVPDKPGNRLWEDLQSRIREEDGPRGDRETTASSKEPGPSKRTAVAPRTSDPSVVGMFLSWLTSGGTPLLLGLCLLLMVWCVFLKLENRRLSQPQVLGGMAELSAVGSSNVRGVPAMDVVSAGESNLILLNLFEVQPRARYHVQVWKSGRQDEVFWASPEIHGLTKDSVILQVPPHFFAPGQYSLRLLRLDEGTETLAAEYSLRVN